MPLDARFLLALTVALGAAFAATPVAIRVANLLQFYDHPSAVYKRHGRATPYLGGAAVMAGFLLAALALTGDSSRTLPVVAGASVLWAVGTLDDRRMVPAVWRVAVEAAFAWLIWRAGLSWHLGLGAGADLTVTVLWVVAVINAFNLFDNMDGAASSMGAVIGLGAAVLGAVHGDAWLVVTAAALSGACMGFLPHNMASPARIFLGDGGSMPLGFCVSVITMLAASETMHAPPAALIAGLLLVGVPVFDTFLVIVSRARRGISVLTGGNDHLTHRTRQRLRTARSVALALGAAQAVLCLLAVLASQGGSPVLAVAVSFYLVAAGSAFAVVEGRSPALSAAGADRNGSPAPGPDREPERELRWAAFSPMDALVVIIGLGAGLSAFFGGYYASSEWVPIGAGLIVLLTASVLCLSPRLTRLGWVVLVSLGGLAAWSLISSQWADSVEQALVGGNRWLVYCGLMASLVVLVRTGRSATWLLAAVGAGIAAVSASVLWRMLGADPAHLFLGGRLNLPLGYVNAEGTVSVLGLWLCMALAERRHAVVAGAGAAGATLMGCLALLSQSRGVAAATILSAAVVLALAPGRRRRSFALLTIAGAVAVAATWLVRVYDVGQAGPLPAHTAHAAAWAMILAAAGAGLAWAVIVGLYERAARSPQRAVAVRRVAVALLAAGALAVTAVAASSASSIGHTARTQWHAFVNLSAPAGSSATQTRLVSGAGNRYDYWRIAWKAFMQRPVVGLGAGNYYLSYFPDRRTNEDIRQPHSIEMQTLSELGLVGALLLAAFVGALGVGAWRMRGPARVSAQERGLMVACIGGVSAWLVHSSVDWIPLLPGVTAIALAMASVLIRRGDGAAARPHPRSVPRPLRRAALPTAVAGVALVLATLSLSRQGAAELFATAAGNALANDPAEAIRDANSSLRLDPYALSPYYYKAAALARFNQAAPAESTLLNATRQAPHEFVTWGLLGDLEVRAGNLTKAGAYYRRAHELNPRDAALAALAANPLSARASE